MKKYNKCLKDLLYKMMMYAKEIHKNASLRPWKKASTLKNLNGYEIKLSTGDEINEYLDIPKICKNLIHGKLNYQNGLRVKHTLKDGVTRNTGKIITHLFKCGNQ